MKTLSIAFSLSCPVYENLINLPENEDEVRKVIQPAMDYLNEIKPYLWNKGETYPATIAQLDNMY